MRCRKIVNGEVVWFNSLGTDDEGKSIPSENFSTEQQAVADSLTQRLSVLRKELWYDVNYGLPLIEKVKSKEYMDAAIADIILENPDVIRIQSFSSQIVNHKYTYNVVVLSTYGELSLSSANFQI